MKALLAVAAALACADAAAACPGLAVENAWIREAPPGAMMAAAYARLVNHGKQALVIDGARGGKDFGGAGLHRTVVENGVSRMREGKLEIAPGASAELAPGGWHLMLFDAKRGLKAGDVAKLALSCGTGSQEFPFTVKASE